jgi:tocopherol O-methyltransferase
MIRPRQPHGAAAVARHYDELDAFYRELWGEDLHHGLWLSGDETPSEAIEDLSRLVAERARIRPGDHVCDVGCGYGGPARYFARHLGARVVGLTLSEVQHRHASARAGMDGRVRFLLRDWMDNQLDSGSFDVVVAIESASHMPDKARFLRECRRVLRPGGRLVMAAWLADERPEPWAVRYLLEPICSEGRLAGLASRSEYARWMKEEDLRLIGFEDLSLEVRQTWTLCLRRLCGRVLGDAEAFRYLMDRSKSERIFALSVARIGLAYRVGALRYGLFTATRA